jgi:hypothetical protein
MDSQFPGSGNLKLREKEGFEGTATDSFSLLSTTMPLFISDYLNIFGT